MIWWRLSMNGAEPPDFTCEQNPTACESSKLVRTASYGWLWCFNILLLVYPAWLCPDWSGPSIPVVASLFDWRLGFVALLFASLLGYFVAALAEAYRMSTPRTDVHRRHWIVAVAWVLVTFIMSSNLFTYVGFVVADRTLYLPSFGFCLLSALCIFECAAPIQRLTSLPRRQIFCLIVVVVVAAYTSKQQAQNYRWHDPVLIWGEGYRVNPDSCITGSEYGMSLTNAGRPAEAAGVS
jgi:hypothetical protein